jgi:hypothetical protein
MLKSNTKISGIYFLSDHAGDICLVKEDTYTPDEKYLDNYYVTVIKEDKEEKVLILDNYGDEWLTGKIRKRLFGTKNHTIGLNTSDGHIYLVSASAEPGSDVYDLFLSDFANDTPIFLPKGYLSKLDELKSCKRPYVLYIAPWAMMHFMDRDFGYDKLIEHLIIQFDFDPYLEVYNDSYRTVTAWNKT